MDEETEEMHVAIVLSTGTGGLPHYTAELANALSERARVTVLKPQNTTADSMFAAEVELREVFTDSNLSFVNIAELNISPKEVLSSFYSFKNISDISDINPDVVHFSDNLFPPTKAFAAFNDIDDSYRTAVTFHELYDGPLSGAESNSSIYQSPSVALGVLGRKFLNFMTPSISPDTYIVHTDNHKEHLLERGIPAQKVSVIPHGAYDIFDPPEKSVPEEDNTLLCFGKIVPSKAIDTVVEAVSIVQDEIPEVKLIIAGEGDIPDRAKAIINDNPENFEVRNEFIPNEEVGEYFARSQAVLIPHRSQGGHSGTLTVAFNFKKPVISTNVGEFPEIVENNGCGITCDPESSVEFAEAIIEILTNNDLRYSMAQSSEKMNQKLSWSNIADRHLSTYSNCR